MNKKKEIFLMKFPGSYLHFPQFLVVRINGFLNAYSHKKKNFSLDFWGKDTEAMLTEMQRLFIEADTSGLRQVVFFDHWCGEHVKRKKTDECCVLNRTEFLLLMENAKKSVNKAKNCFVSKKVFIAFYE